MTNTDDKSETRRASVPREELFTQFNQTITTVRSYTNHLETEIGRPAVRFFFEIFEERPILATFLATLTALSCFPILAFVTTSAVTIVSFVTFALVISLFAALAVTIGSLLILIFTLVASVFIAAAVTAVCFHVYLTFRLFTLVRQNGVSEGFLCWIGEMWRHINVIGSTFSLFRDAQPCEPSTEDSDLGPKVA